MNHKIFEELYRYEDYNWVAVARRRLVEYFLNIFDGNNLLEVGVGSGYNLHYLSKKYKCVGIDISKDAIKFSSMRGENNLLLADVQSIPINNKTFDFAISLEVLEHVEDDLKALKELNRVLKKNGILIITIPAFMLLWSIHDEVLSHKRRYSKKELTIKLEKTGFEVLKIGYRYSLLFPFVLSYRKIKRIRKKKKIEIDNFMGLPDHINFALTKLMALENSIISKINLPIGVSLFCVARKKF